jgi:YegS/Rv2252/BmrU family lipid kinase
VTLTLIVNPFAGGGRPGRRLADVRAALDALGMDHRVEPTRSLEHARELAVAAAAAGEVAVAFGGDGLIGAVADALRGGEGVLGVLPGGRGNDFARMLGLPLDPAVACGVLATGSVGVIDLGQVGSRAFVAIAGCGFDSDANRIANATKLISGQLVYVYGAVRALAAWRPATFTVTLDDAEPRIITGYSVAAANSRSYGGGMMLAPGARLDDGLLDVVIVTDMPKLRLLALLPTVYRGTHVSRAEVEVHRCTRVRIQASRPMTMYGDGDPIAELPVTVTALPAAVRVLLPEPLPRPDIDGA